MVSRTNKFREGIEHMVEVTRPAEVLGSAVARERWNEQASSDDPNQVHARPLGHAWLQSTSGTQDGP